MGKWASIDMIPDSVMDVFDGKTRATWASVCCRVSRNSENSFTRALQRQSNIICVTTNTQATCLLPCFLEGKKSSNIQSKNPLHVAVDLKVFEHFHVKNNYIGLYVCEIIQDGFYVIFSLIFEKLIFIPLSAAFHAWWL